MIVTPFTAMAGLAARSQMRTTHGGDTLRRVHWEADQASIGLHTVRKQAGG